MGCGCKQRKTTVVQPTTTKPEPDTTQTQENKEEKK